MDIEIAILAGFVVGGAVCGGIIYAGLQLVANAIKTK